MSSIERTALESLYIRRRLNGKLLNPARSSPTEESPAGIGFDVTTDWRVPGSKWSLGYHTGQDYACPEGSLAVAVSWGEVIWAGTYGGWSSNGTYGVHVIVRSSDGIHDYAVCHLYHTAVAVGQKVRPGTILGYSGNSGNVTGYHIHFEARPIEGKYGSDVDPRLACRKLAA